MKPATRHCAVYTRKSSEEGLEQDFNSLDAQKESCLAYIASQKAEGWQAVETGYSDGGFSGGNMERPGLKKLLEDIKEGKVHIVVVYKIDRLTRSLMDFSKLVEIFDQHGVTFVSVTQSFNTTTSMGRLTLNVLLSFAQFEREVTGERIRDKIAASKKKGMWMGGVVPIGYVTKGRELIIDEEQAEKVRYIFKRYLELGAVWPLMHDLKQKEIKSIPRVYKDGSTRGPHTFVRGGLYRILRNPIYIGKIRHGGEFHDGKHPPIISMELWQAVQEKLESQSTTVRGQRKNRDVNLLKGLLFSVQGVPYSPVFANRHGRQYRYYVTQDIIQNNRTSKTPIDRLSAFETEKKVEEGIRHHLTTPELAAELFNLNCVEDQHYLKTTVDKQAALSAREIIHDVVKKITVEREALILHADICQLAKKLSLGKRGLDGEPIMKQLEVPHMNFRNHKEVAVIESANSSKDPFDLPPGELKNLVRGLIWREEHFNGLTLRQIATRENFSEGYVGRCIFQSLGF